MCGIVGILNSEKKGSVDAGLLKRMNNRLTHRGPDDAGYFVDRNVGLAMRRLSIIDIEGGHQPITNETEDIWTVFNGEIYNFKELRAELIKKGHRFRTHTDTEVIVHLYEEDGEEFVQKLRGMFAIALWDGRAGHKKFLLYRDRVGIKPVHYWFHKETLLFASEAKAILEHPEVGRDISLSALSDYLSFLYIPTPKSIYQEVQKLPAGHFLRYQGGQIEIESYWDFDFTTDHNLTEKQWVEKLQGTLEEAVRLHLISDVPVGAFLSGGMDSSAIVALMSQISSVPTKTYSIGFSDQQFNELPYAKKIAQHFGTEHHEQVVEANAFELLPKIIAGFDEPFADSSAIPTYLVSEFARKDVKVALSGDGGDELFGGYLWTRKELWLEKYRRAPRFLRDSIEKILLKKGYAPSREASLRSLFERFVYDAKTTPAESFGRRVMSFQPWMKEELFQPHIWDALKQEENSSDLLNSYYEKDAAHSVIDKLFYLDAKVYLPDDLLTKVDRMSMMHSLEVRVPLLDHKLVELAGQIPHTLKFKGKTTKYILKQAMKKMLPPGILRQRKQGFSIPLERWFRNELSQFAEKILLSDDCVSRKYFRMEYVKQLVHEQRSGRQRFGSQLYSLIVFELWNRLGLSDKTQTTSNHFSMSALLK